MFLLLPVALQHHSHGVDLAPVVQLNKARTGLPTITPRPVPAPKYAAAFSEVPLNDLQKAMVELAQQYARARAPLLATPLAEPREAIQTHSDAWRVLAKLRAIERGLL